MAKKEVLPPERIYCPLCRDGGGNAEYCYQTDVTDTGIQLHAYRCQGCARWLIVRWTPSDSHRYVIADALRTKPRVVRTGSRIVPEVS